MILVSAVIPTRGRPELLIRAVCSVLTQTLRDLERDGIIARRVFPTKPPSVEYRMTKLGESLLVPLVGLIAWAESNQSRIAIARTAFDGADPLRDQR